MHLQKGRGKKSNYGYQQKQIGFIDGASNQCLAVVKNVDYYSTVCVGNNPEM